MKVQSTTLQGEQPHPTLLDRSSESQLNISASVLVSLRQNRESEATGRGECLIWGHAGDVAGMDCPHPILALSPEAAESCVWDTWSASREGRPPAIPISSRYSPLRLSYEWGCLLPRTSQKSPLPKVLTQFLARASGAGESAKSGSHLLASLSVGSLDPKAFLNVQGWGGALPPTGTANSTKGNPPQTSFPLPLLPKAPLRSTTQYREPPRGIPASHLGLVSRSVLRKVIPQNLLQPRPPQPPRGNTVLQEPLQAPSTQA